MGVMHGANYMFTLSRAATITSHLDNYILSIFIILEIILIYVDFLPHEEIVY